MALHVDTRNADNLRYWCKKLHCTEHQLREAVSQVGPLPSNVDAYLRQRSHSLDNVELPPGKRPS